MVKLTDEAKQAIGNIRPSLVATATRTGKPNISIKGLLHVLDDEHVILADVASSNLVNNIRENGQVAIICLAVPGRKGCLVYGTGEVLESGYDFDKVSAEFNKSNVQVRNVVKVTVEEVETFYNS
jgi:predicted pyridoxine 5'-phosphate oxidase superfamily flavin-nucleotide-binding protein